MKKGFTLIELLVAVGLMTVVMASVTMMLAATLKATRKAAAINRVKNEGAYAVQTMAGMLRYAKSVEGCSGNKIDFTPLAGNATSFSCQTSPTAYIASGSAKLTATEFSTSSCAITCPDAHTVNIVFGLQKTGDVSESSIVNFDAQVTLRNVQ